LLAPAMVFLSLPHLALIRRLTTPDLHTTFLR